MIKETWLVIRCNPDYPAVSGSKGETTPPAWSLNFFLMPLLMLPPPISRAISTVFLSSVIANLCIFWRGSSVLRPGFDFSIRFFLVEYFIKICAIQIAGRLWNKRIAGYVVFWGIIKISYQMIKVSSFVQSLITIHIKSFKNWIDLNASEACLNWH